MTTTTLERRVALPEDMHHLLRDYPREAWPDHPNFAVSVQNWMGAHQMFRQLAEITRADTEAYLSGQRSADDYAGRLGYYGNLLVRNLHGHHNWEDRSFFPELRAADPNFGDGLDLLEGDHQQLDQLLNDLTRQSNRVVQLLQLDEQQAGEEARPLRDLFEKAGGFLQRHLTDEEDLVVPLILHHKLRG